MTKYIRPHEYDDKERYNQLLNFLTDYIYTVTVYEGKVLDTYHDPGCFSVTGYESKAYLDDPELWFRMVHEEDREAVLEQAGRALCGEEVTPLSIVSFTVTAVYVGLEIV